MNNAKCTICSTEFRTFPCRLRSGFKQYCSRKCSLQSRFSQESKTCATCGKEFVRHKSRTKYGRGIYCSRPCKYHAISKELSHLWKGGITPENKKIRTSLQYKQWRKSVFDRDNYTCQACGARGCELHADHELPFAYFPDLRFEVLNGRTLCVNCHRKTDTWGSRGYTLYGFDYIYDS